MNASPFGLIETMRLDGEIRLLERHMARLRRSADHFAISLDEEAVRSRIAEACAEVDVRMPRRVRLLLRPDGVADVTLASITTDHGSPVAAVSGTPISSSDPFLYHKTTRRNLYDREWKSANDVGLFEVIYLNEQGLVAEGSRTNIFARIGGRLLTPHVSCGLLPGVYRSLLLETHRDAAEGTLTVHDLKKADALFVCNAVIGLRRVRLIDSIQQS